MKLKLLKYGVVAFAATSLSLGAYFAYQIAPLANGYSAKYICSHVFTSGQDPEEAMEFFVKPVHPVFEFVDLEVDYQKKEVSSSFLGFLRPSTAVYRDDCGCTLLINKTAKELKGQSAGLDLEKKVLKDTVWPYGNQVNYVDFPEIDTAALNKRINQEFVEVSGEPGELKNTFAVVVAYKNRIIAEQYRKGINPETPLLSWSASKSVTSALIGRLVQTGKIDIYKPSGIREWQSDNRKNITIDQLLRMESGLFFEEKYAPLSDAVEMLYEQPDMGGFAARMPSFVKPDSVWQYSSGTTNILSKIILEKTGGTLESLEKFAHEEFFNKIGITSAVFEHDENGAFVGSSYFYASPKDWLRLALLYKQKGVWNGEQILPPGWVDYSLTPTPHAPAGKYGAQIWLNAGYNSSQDKLLPRLPEDVFVFQGYQGQWVIVIPSKDIMIARFGATNNRKWKMEDLVVDIVNIIEKQEEGINNPVH